MMKFREFSNHKEKKATFDIKGPINFNVYVCVFVALVVDAIVLFDD